MQSKLGGSHIKRCWILLLLLNMLPCNVLNAQDAASGQELSEAEQRALKEKQDNERVLELDIKTSTFIELAEWSREIGLGEGGSREDLAYRLRNHYQLPMPTEKTDWKRVITIESARTTEYFTLETVDEEYARLSGGVQLNLKDGEALHKISAWEILYNRTRNVVSARGNVVHVKEEAGVIETFKGESIIINLDTWIGSFIDSISERSMSGTETSYRFAGQVISKTDDETTVLKRASVSSALSDEPYWSLNASRLWLFPGSDWALFNAVLKVGEIPVLYLPFFAYPADDVVFHPVLGTRSRHGYYLQTTTYIMGRPTVDPAKSNSISKILGSADGMEKVREGLFLRSTGKRETSPNDKILSVLFDAYSKLGLYGGVELSLPNLAFLNQFKLSTGVGWTRTLFYTNDLYTPFQISQPEWSSHWDHSYFFGARIPVRYRFNLETSASGKFGSLDLKLPLYADPFIDDDLYLKRSEQMDWMNLITGGFADETLSSTTIGSYQWNLTMRPNITTRIFAPVISNLSINTISTFLTFIPSRDLSNDSEYISDPVMRYSPERQFFIPDKLTPYAISASMSGTPISISSSNAQEKQTPQQPLKDIGEPVSPWGTETEQQAISAPAASTNTAALTPPALAQTWVAPRANGLRFAINYNITPSSATEMQYYTKRFSSTQKGTAQDIRWSDFESVLSNFRTDGSLNFALSEPNNNFFSTSIGLSARYQWQDHGYIATSKLTASEINSLRLSDYRGTQWTINSNYNFTLNPFYWSDVWKSTNFQYSMTSLVARSLFDDQKYTSDKAANGNPDFMPDPSWKTTTFDWTKEFISAHRLTANLSANVMDKSQNISFTMDLPPLYRAFSASATARIWIWDSNASMQIQEDTDESKAAGNIEYHYINGYIFKPLYLTQSFNLGTSRSAKLYTVWDPELDEWTNLTVDFILGSFSTSFASIRMFKYNYQAGLGWRQESASTGGTQRLYPRDFSLRWSPSYKVGPFFHKLISMSFSARSDITVDLQRYTYSKFSFSLSMTLNISKFLDFSMGASSENAEIYRYMQNLPIFADLRSEIGEIPGQNNPILDLINSFRFDNEELRKQSGFKLRSFNFSAVHHLGDWDASANVSFSPYLDTTGDASQWQYKFRTSFSFLVQWLPITEIETRIDYENEKFFRKTN